VEQRRGSLWGGLGLRLAGKFRAEIEGPGRTARDPGECSTGEECSEKVEELLWSPLQIVQRRLRSFAALLEDRPRFRAWGWERRRHAWDESPEPRHQKSSFRVDIPQACARLTPPIPKTTLLLSPSMSVLMELGARRPIGDPLQALGRIQPPPGQTQHPPRDTKSS
jgi:hypothetical protein